MPICPQCQHAHMVMCPYAHVPICPCGHMPICPQANMSSFGTPIYMILFQDSYIKASQLGLLYKGSRMAICPFAHMPMCPYVHMRICPCGRVPLCSQAHMPTIGTPVYRNLYQASSIKESHLSSFIKDMTIWPRGHMPMCPYGQRLIWPYAHCWVSYIQYSLLSFLNKGISIGTSV